MKRRNFVLQVANTVEAWLVVYWTIVRTKRTILLERGEGERGGREGRERGEGRGRRGGKEGGEGGRRGRRGREEREEREGSFKTVLSFVSSLSGAGVPWCGRVLPPSHWQASGSLLPAQSRDTAAAQQRTTGGGGGGGRGEEGGGEGGHESGRRVIRVFVP